jgi:hypothetical protein
MGTRDLTSGWQGGIWDRRKNGGLSKWLTITAVKDDGRCHPLRRAHLDITERKRAKPVRQLAFCRSLPIVACS